ncbi:MAG TPA: peroxiredoxin [Bacteroidaceae bacterium]|jgi:peroxiredoxin Q/BCP|nr:peroxiredoxin [Bacteroidales bacterium]HBA12784.1 peroxiredoxin [Bacteroidales bacterium]HOD69006.1 peroxiredoxin [Bacteroidaceae bacterium]HPX98969.1 peroxiredoxin [Bacteroidaceae bacterium]HQL26502.1 peroxiredoxin [Bacteroidaceae bacterium]
MIKVGDRMPLFKAMAQDGKEYSSSDLLGKKTIIYAYPKDNTPGCTAQAVNLRDNYRELLAQGYQLFGISRDSIESHIKFAGKYDLPFPLLSDPDHVILEQLGAWGEKKLYGKTVIGSIRKTFIFDESGICIRIIDKVNTKDHTAQILETV